MPRQVRIEYEGAFYHVMARGNRRNRIFASPGKRGQKRGQGTNSQFDKLPP
jgi:hypothetical protein